MNILYFKKISDGYYQMLFSLGKDLHFLEALHAGDINGGFICQFSKGFSDFLTENNIDSNVKQDIARMVREEIRACTETVS